MEIKNMYRYEEYVGEFFWFLKRGVAGSPSPNCIFLKTGYICCSVSVQGGRIFSDLMVLPWSLCSKECILHLQIEKFRKKLIAVSKLAIYYWPYAEIGHIQHTKKQCIQQIHGKRPIDPLIITFQLFKIN